MFASIFTGVCACVCNPPTNTQAVFDTAVSGLISRSRGTFPPPGRGACPRCSSHTCHVSGGSDAAALLFVRWARRHTRAETREGVHREREQEKKRMQKKGKETGARRGGGEIKAEELLTLTVMRNMEDDAEGDIMTLLTADQLFTASVSPWEEFRVGL